MPSAKNIPPIEKIEGFKGVYKTNILPTLSPKNREFKNL